MTEHIQINDTAPRVQYLADGVLADFTYPFAIFKSSDLEVWLGDQKQSSGFTVAGAGASTGGIVSLSTVPSEGTLVTLRRRVTIARTTDYQSDGLIRAKTLNDEFDFQTAALQQLADDLSAVPRRAPFSPNTAALTLPEPVAGRALKWNDDASGLVNSAGEADASNPGAAAGVYFTATGSTVLRSVESRLQERRSVLDFIPPALHAGIRDQSNTADLTEYLQAAFDNNVGHFPAGAYRISAGLRFIGPVLVMEDGAYISPEGSGYTALTITTNGAYSAGWHIIVRKTDWSFFTGNGIFWDNPANADIESLKAYGIVGSGIRLSRMWDCHIGSISTTLCGSPDHYALSIEDGGDTSNTSFIGHIQVELSNTKAIYISPNTRHVVFNSIHSERTYAAEGVQSYELSGALCSYHNVRIGNHSGSAYGSINMELVDSEINSLCVESPIPATVSAGADLATQFVNCKFSGPVSTATNQLGNISFQHCRFADLSMATGGKGWLVQDCDISGILSVGYISYEIPGDFLTDMRGYALRRHFRNCRIASVSAASGNAAASFSNCVISAVSAVFNWVVYDNCNIAGSIVCIGNYIEMRGCRLVGNLVGGYHGQGWIIDSEIIGDLVTDGSGQQPFAFDNVRISGAYSALFLNPPNYGTWHAGQRCDRFIAASSQPMGWTVNDFGTWLALPGLP